jgi:biotin synthase
MNLAIYRELAEQALAGDELDQALCLRVLEDPELELLPLLHAAYTVRKHHHGKAVSIHILNNVQNGHCPEDCNYCSQAKNSKTPIHAYGLKKEEEVLEEARLAHASGAFRYCMVFAGTGPSSSRTEQIAELIRKIKQRYPIEVCVSAGLLDDEKAKVLKEAGCDRLNHNLNTSAEHYGKVCTTHDFADRMRTLQAARRQGLEVCSGMIVGMGEQAADIVAVARELRNVKAASIPVNFLIPFEGNVFNQMPDLKPEYCLRVLCLFRFLNPACELRAAAGREGHLRSLEVLCLYPANSIFLDGYLNSKGGSRRRVLKMIQDAGFEIRSEYDLGKILADEEHPTQADNAKTGYQVEESTNYLKGAQELRPALRSMPHST